MYVLNIHQEYIFISWNSFMRMENSLVFYLKGKTKKMTFENKNENGILDDTNAVVRKIKLC